MRARSARRLPMAAAPAFDCVSSTPKSACLRKCQLPAIGASALGTEVVAALRVEQCVRVAERVDLVVTLFARAGEVEHDVEKRIEPALRCDAATAWTLRER